MTETGTTTPVWVIRLNRDWVEFRASKEKPKRVITYFTNKRLAKEIKLPNFRLRNVSHEGGRCLGASRLKKLEGLAARYDLTIPNVDETLKLPKEVAAKFLDLKWRKRNGL